MADGVGEGRSGEELSPGQTVHATSVPGFADAQGVGPGDNMQRRLGEHLTGYIGVSALQAASLKQGGGELVSVGGVDAIEARAEDVGDPVATGIFKQLRADVGCRHAVGF